MLRYRTKIQAPRDRGGFTLVELMITVAVMAILAAIATPAMQGLINANRLAGAASELESTLQIARSEAVRRNARVTVCASTDGTTCAATTAWTRWIVHGMDNTASPPVDDVIRDSAPAASVQISGPAAGILFRPSGLIDAAAAVTACMPTTEPAQNRRVVTVMISGALSTAKVNGGGTC